MEAGLFMVLVVAAVISGVYVANVRTFYGSGPLLGVLIVVALVGLFLDSIPQPGGGPRGGSVVLISIVFSYFWAKSKPSKPPVSPRASQASGRKSWHEFEPAAGVPWWFALGCVIWGLCLITGAYVHLTRV